MKKNLIERYIEHNRASFNGTASNVNEDGGA